MTVTVNTKDDRPDRAHHKADAEHGKGGEQRDGRVAAWKEQLRDDRHEVAVDAVIVPFEHIADDAGGDRSLIARPGRRYGHCRHVRAPNCVSPMVPAVRCIVPAKFAPTGYAIAAYGGGGGPPLVQRKAERTLSTNVHSATRSRSIWLFPAMSVRVPETRATIVRVSTPFDVLSPMSISANGIARSTMAAQRSARLIVSGATLARSQAATRAVAARTTMMTTRRITAFYTLSRCVSCMSGHASFEAPFGRTAG